MIFLAKIRFLGTDLAMFNHTIGSLVKHGKRSFVFQELCEKHFKRLIMAKEDLTQQNQGAVAPIEDVAPAVEERPNRKAFSDRFKKRHAGIDFEDKEARYGAMNEDADMLSQYEDSGRALSDILDSNKWIAAMIMDLKDNPDLSPIEWMATQGIDIQQALDDDKTAKKVAEQIAKHQEDVADQEKHEEDLRKNMQRSADDMASLGLSIEEEAELWEKVWKMIGDAENGIISTETWKLFKNAYNYDDDVKSAREEGAMTARNEKIQNQLKKSEKSNVPPTLSSSGSASPKKQQPRRSGGIDFFDGLTK